jgi:selenocysteine lyase/cysteine desulfurase
MTQSVTEEITEAEARRYRAEFSIFEHTTYLNSCSLGPLSGRALSGLQQYAEDWARLGAPAWWQLWMPKLDEAKARFARLIGAQPHEVTISHSITSALSTIASCFSYADRPAVVCAQPDFPTIPYQWLARAKDGVQVRFVESDDGISVPLSAYDRAIDRSTQLVATSHVFYATGAIQPIRPIADLAHDRGALMVVDGYHAPGVIPVDVKALGADIYVGGVLKWLMGGPGLTFIYVREELIEQLRPSATGWFASADQFAFETTRFQPAPTADRFEMGTPSVPTAYAGVESMGMVLEVGPERIHERVQMLTDRVVAHAQRAGYGIASPLEAEARGGIVMLRLDRPNETVENLKTHGFTVDYRPGLLRVSPHFYNTLDDVDRLMAEIDAIQGR